MLLRLFMTLGVMFCGTAYADSQRLEIWQLETVARDTQNESGESSDASVVVTLNLEALALTPGMTANLPLPSGSVQSIQVVQSDPTLTGGRILTADFDDGSGWLYLYRGLNSVFGQLATQEGLYSLEGNSRSGRIQVEQVQHIDLEGDVITYPRSQNSTSAVASTPEGNDVLDFLYLYDQSMIDNFGWGFPDLAASDVGFLNSALAEGEIGVTASIADFQFFMADPSLIPDSGGNMEAFFFALAEDRNGFEGVSARAALLGADIISANTGVFGGGGLAFKLDPSIDDNGRIQLNGSFNDGVLAHETGHNLGLAHDMLNGTEPARPSVDWNCGVPECWARGFRLLDPFTGEWVYTSIMDPNVDPNTPGAGRQTFSNPERPCSIRGSVCGVPGVDDGLNEGADAVRSLREWAGGLPSVQIPNRRLRTAILPSSRFVTTGQPATAFMTVINPNTVDATDCRIQHHGPYRDSFSFQATDPSTNAPIGNPNEPVDIPAGTFKTFVISLTPGENMSGINFGPYASCANAPMAEISAGTNTLILGASSNIGPDLVALAATIGNSGIVEVPDGRRGVFSVATINIGGSGTVTVSARSLDHELPATGEVCQTDAAGACLAPPAPNLTLDIGPNETPTFGVFIRTAYSTPFSPRQRFQFEMAVDGDIRGATSVAVRSAAALESPETSALNAQTQITQTVSGTLRDGVTGYASGFELVSQPSLGSVTLDTVTGAYSYTAGSIGGTDHFEWRAFNSAGSSNAVNLSINLSELPLPVVQSFAYEDDTDGLFEVDLAALSSGIIDQFVMITPPNIPYTLNGFTGVLTMELPSTPGTVEFEYAAQNASGNGSSGTGRVEITPFNTCMPVRPTRHRIMRRLQTFSVSDTGVPTIAEAEDLYELFCMPPAERGEIFVTGHDPARSLFLAITVRDGTFDSFSPQRYDILFQSPQTGFFHVEFQACKLPGQTVLAECPPLTPQ